MAAGDPPQSPELGPEVGVLWPGSLACLLIPRAEAELTQVQQDPWPSATPHPAWNGAGKEPLGLL